MQRFKTVVIPVFLAILSIATAASAQSVQFKEFVLKNGLRVILSEDHAAPTYSIAVTYNVGSRNERPGRTGFAHLFEHMMFQGSKNVGKGEHFLLVENNGGSMNGTTNPDRTNYYQTLPANQLDLGLFLEADRMRSLALTQANFENQRETVKEERRMNYDNQPYGKTRSVLFETAYDNFAYKHSTIGSMDDLNAATLEDVTRFFKTYYAPNNAVIALVGDFKTDDALARVKKYFEDIPSAEAAPPVDTTEPVQKAERRKTLDDPLAQLTRLDIAFKIPPGNTPEWYALSIASSILTDGRSSRLFQQMVQNQQLVLSVNGGPLEMRGPGLATFSLMVRPGVDPKDVERTFYEEIERLKTEPVSNAEIEKIRMGARRENIEQLQGTLYRAIRLSQLSVYFGNPALINQWEAKVNAVTKEQIQDAVKKYFVETGRTVVMTVPKPKAAGGPGGDGR